MSKRDYKNISPKKIKETNSLGVKLAFLSGFFSGLLVAFVIYLWEFSLPFISDFTTNKEDNVVLNFSGYKEPDVVSAKKKDDESKYPTFYRFLPESSIPTPAQNNINANSSETQQDGVYLQVGSFRSLDQADAQKASLAMIGMFSKISTVTGGDSQKWYRVRIGPVGKSSARILKNKLEEKNFKVIVISGN